MGHQTEGKHDVLPKATLHRIETSVGLPLVLVCHAVDVALAFDAFGQAGPCRRWRLTLLARTDA